MTSILVKIHSDVLLVLDLMPSQAIWTRFDRKSEQCTKKRCVLAANRTGHGNKNFVDPQGVPIIEDKDLDSTDFMKCLNVLAKVEQAAAEVSILLYEPH